MKNRREFLANQEARFEEFSDENSRRISRWPLSNLRVSPARKVEETWDLRSDVSAFEGDPEVSEKKNGGYGVSLVN